MRKKIKIISTLLTIALLCFTTAMAGVDASADAVTTLETSQYVTINEGSTKSFYSGTGSVEHKGLLLSPADEKTAIEGSINGVFNKGEDVKFQFSFPGDYTAEDGTATNGEGFVEFKVESLTDSDEFFKIIIREFHPQTNAAIIYVEDKHGQVRSTGDTNNNGKIWQINTSMRKELTCGWFGDDTHASTWFDLKWTNDVLTVYASSLTAQGNSRYLAAFDGTYDTTATDNGFNGKIGNYKATAAEVNWGLEKLDFSNGYKVSFTSKTTEDTFGVNYFPAAKATTVTPIVIESVGETSFATATVASEPAWYGRFAQATVISTENSYLPTNLVGNVQVQNATYIFLNNPDGAPHTVAKIEIKKGEDGTYETVQAGKVINEAGTYYVRYTAVNGATSPTNTKEYVFDVVDSFDSLTDPIEITLNKALDGMYQVGEEIFVPSGTYVYPSRVEVPEQKVDKVEISNDGGTTYTLVETDTLVLFDEGTYQLRYTAVDGKSNEGNTYVTESFEVCSKDVFNLKHILKITSGSPTVKSGAKGMGSVEHNGILVSPNSENTPFEGKFNGVFTGNTDIQLSFPGQLRDSVHCLGGRVEFRIQDVNNTQNYFDIIFKYTWRSTWGAAIFVRDGKGNVRTVSPSGKYEGHAEEDKANLAIGLAGWFGQDDKISSHFSLTLEDDVWVIRSVNATNDTMRVIAKFDGTYDETANNQGFDKEKGTTFGLPKVSFPDGYTISFTSALSEKRVSPIIFEKLNGVSLSDKYLNDSEKITVKNIANINDETITRNATVNKISTEELGLGALVDMTVDFAGINIEYQQKIYPDVSSIVFSIVGEHNFTYNFRGMSITQKLNIIDGAPVMQFVNGETVMVYCIDGPNKGDLTLAATDVLATDEVEGIVSDISLKIKAPGETEFKDVAFGKFAPTAEGTYILRYISKDSNGNEAYLEKTITVISGDVPVITVNGDIPARAKLNTSLTVPTATATKGTVVCNVYYEQEKLTIDSTLSFDRVGTYTISYYVADESGESLRQFVIVVAKDSDAPIITIDNEPPSEVKVGSVVNLGMYSANDEVDGSLSVTVKVWYGTTGVTVTENKFVASDVGVYSIVYSCRDIAGNIAEVKKSVTVFPETLERPSTSVDKPNGGDNATGGCARRIVVGTIIGAAILTLFTLGGIFFLNKKRKKTKLKK